MQLSDGTITFNTFDFKVLQKFDTYAALHPFSSKYTILRDGAKFII